MLVQGRIHQYSLESPPVSELVPLNGVGAPTKEYDMMASSLLQGVSAREVENVRGQQAELPWEKKEATMPSALGSGYSTKKRSERW